MLLQRLPHHRSHHAALRAFARAVIIKDPCCASTSLASSCPVLVGAGAGAPASKIYRAGLFVLRSYLPHQYRPEAAPLDTRARSTGEVGASFGVPENQDAGVEPHLPWPGPSSPAMAQYLRARRRGPLPTIYLVTTAPKNMVLKPLR